MIARTWHGLTPLETKTAFRKYLGTNRASETPWPCPATGGLCFSCGAGATPISFSAHSGKAREDVLAYAGDNPSLAVTYPEDAAFGLISDPIVIHQEVPEARNPFVEGEPRQNLH